MYGQIRPMREKDTWNRHFKLSEQALELVTVFKDASRNFIFIFLFKKAG